MSDGRLPRTYVDTTIFLDAYEGSSAHSEPLRRLFNAFARKPNLAVTTLAELLGKEAERGWGWQTRSYLDLIVFNEAFDLRSLSRDILIETGAFRRAAKERNRRVKLGDAIHAVTSVHAGCRFFLTCDKRLLVPHPVVRLLPDDPDFAALGSILDA